MKKYIGFEEPLLLHVVSKHALSELQPLITTRTALYRTGKKITITISRVMFTPNYYLFY